MATTPAVLIQPKFAEVSQTTQYTSDLVQSAIDKFTGTNVTGSPATITINLVPAAGSVTTSNVIVFTKTIPAGKSYIFPEIVGHILESGGFISTICSAANTIVIMSSGRKFS